MKTALTTFILLLAIQFSEAQTNVYQPYPLDNASWTIYTQLYNGQTYIEDWYTRSWSGDTIINGLTYTRVFDHPSMIGVRQDIPNETIYYIDDQGVEHDASFDQSVQVGDTIQITLEFKALNMYSGDPYTEEAVITSVGAIQLGAISHKTIAFESITPGVPYNMSHICGVGCTNATTSISSAFDIACYYVDGYQLLGNPFNPYCTASSEELSNQNISIYPNPSDGMFFIDYDHSAELKEIHLLDMTGKRITQFEVENIENGFDISTIPSGVYMVELVFEKGNYRTTLVR